MSRPAVNASVGLFKQLSHRLQGKRLVGRDAAGNLYFIDSKTAQRRWVEYSGGDILGDTSTVPMSWHSWLRYTRPVPPTPAEVEKEIEDNRAMQERVRAINAVDAKLRLQEMAEKHLNQARQSSHQQAQHTADRGVAC